MRDTLTKICKAAYHTRTPGGEPGGRALIGSQANNLEHLGGRNSSRRRLISALRAGYPGPVFHRTRNPRSELPGGGGGGGTTYRCARLEHAHHADHGITRLDTGTGYRNGDQDSFD